VKGNRVVRSLVVRDFLASGRVQTRWNGKNARGKWVASGRYSVLISATDNLGNSAEARVRVRVVS
jgi:flagellar hook assembly protein FlgD